MSKSGSIHDTTHAHNCLGSEGVKEDLFIIVKSFEFFIIKKVNKNSNKQHHIPPAWIKARMHTRTHATVYVSS